MKKLLMLILYLCMIAMMPTAAMANDEMPTPDDYDENGIPIYYIDVSMEEWERTYLEHPHYQNYDPDREVRFIVRESENSVSLDAICYSCGRNPYDKESEWREVYSAAKACTNAGVGDFLYANTFIFRDYCSNCGYLTNFYWNTNKLA